MKVLNKIIMFVLNIIIILIFFAVCLFGAYAFQTKIQKKEYANIFGYTLFEVITGSMSPAINQGDVVVVKITDDLKENDIAVYTDDGAFITHRIISMDENTVITKGDANNGVDSPRQKQTLLRKSSKNNSQSSNVEKNFNYTISININNCNNNFIWNCNIF